MVVLLLPLTFVLIPKHGTMGAAWSFAMSVTIGTTFAVILVYREDSRFLYQGRCC